MISSKTFAFASLVLVLTACTKDDERFILPKNVLPDSSWPAPPLATPMNIAGTWYSRTGNNAVNCDVGEYVDAKTMVFSQDRYHVSILTSAGDQFEGTMDGDILRWTGSYPERSGMTDFTSATLVFSADVGAGDATWTWSDGTDACNGTMTISVGRTATPESASNSWPAIADPFTFVDNVAYFSGTLGEGGDSDDYFAFVAEQDAVLQVELSHFDAASTNLDLVVLDEALQEIGRSDSIDSFEMASVPVISGQRYYVQVAAISIVGVDHYHLALDLN